VLLLRGLQRRFKSGAGELLVLDGVDFEIQPGEIVGLVGPSGSGKSSLLHAAGLLEQPSGGEVLLAGVSGWDLNDAGRAALRRANIGFVYQFHHLLPEFSALENVALPALIGGKPNDQTRAEAQRLLSSLGLKERLDHRPSQLSGGEQQRVAIARALVNRPLLILADEPTGNLDPDTAEAVFNALSHLVRAEGTSAIIATHNYELARFMDRVVGLSHGKLVELDPRRAIEPQLSASPRSATSSAITESLPAPRLYPWARFWAKQLDFALHWMSVGLAVGFALTLLPRLFGLSLEGLWWAPYLVAAATVLSFPLIDALWVSATGSSPGRLAFRFRVQRRNGDKPSFNNALARAWTCLFFGQGLTLGLIWLLTCWASYSNLQQHGASLWDRDAGTEVVHRGPAWWSWFVLACWIGMVGLGAWAVAQPLSAQSLGF
jgi:lipoprotein-releasing system ATP-binding protein